MKRILLPLASVSLFALITACANDVPKTKVPAPSTGEDLGKAPEGTDAKIEWALAGHHRSEKNKARDRYRHPKETLAFFGVKEDSSVLELWPGGGWYTEVLAPLLHDNGKLVVTNFDEANAPVPIFKRFAKEYREKLAASPAIYNKVHIVTVNPPATLDLGAPGSMDVVLTFRNLHNWVDAGYVDQVLGAAFKVLKPGGFLGIEDHRASEGANPKAENGYLPESFVKAACEKVGFVLDAKSDINANPADTKDYPEGVWTLPPSLRLGEKDRAKYERIGESDRLTMRFRKP